MDKCKRLTKVPNERSEEDDFDVSAYFEPSHAAQSMTGKSQHRKAIPSAHNAHATDFS